MSESDESGEGVRISPKSLSRRESASPGPVSSKKRTADESAEAVREKPKRKKKKEGREIDDGTFDLEAGINTVFANMDSRLLADFVAQRLKRFEGDLSTVELDDRQIPEKAFKDTSMWSMQRNLESLPAYLENFSKSKDKAIDLSNAPKSQGSPHTLVVTGAGLRAADLTRYMELEHVRRRRMLRPS
ncbi:MAG: hypothetical protein M1837_007187 [Sclerophora amabilis]|nr:MAG: hypothetical protein M1837_007187 [Sclerophora amabilis]